MNQVIDQVNKEMKTSLPPFDLTSGGNEQKAMTQYALSVEHYLHSVQEQQKSTEDIHTLIDQIGSIPLDEAKQRLNSIIHAANQSLAPPYQLQALRK